MTIEEAIRYYEDKNVVLTEEEALANTIAIETMRKYKKIEEIIRKYDVAWEFHHMKPTIDEIREVIENRND